MMILIPFLAVLSVMLSTIIHLLSSTLVSATKDYCRPSSCGEPHKHKISFPSQRKSFQLWPSKLRAHVWSWSQPHHPHSTLPCTATTSPISHIMMINYSNNYIHLCHQYHMYDLVSLKFNIDDYIIINVKYIKVYNIFKRNI